MKIKQIISCMLIAASALTISNLSAQPGGGGMGGPGGGMGGPGMMGGGGGGISDPLASAGYFEIKAEKVFKKVKIKDPKCKAEAEKIVAEYEAGYAKASRELAEQIEAMKEMAKLISSGELKMGRPQQNGESGQISENTQGKRQRPQEGEEDPKRAKIRKMMESSRTVRAEMMKLHKALNENMTKALPEKEAAKWSRFYEVICDDNNFSLKERKRPEGGMQGGREGGMQGGGMRGGMGGGMGGF